MTIVDSFSGAAADVPRHQRTAAVVLRVLAKHPRVSTWDMSEKPWLRQAIAALKGDGYITEVEEPFPWHRFVLTEAGKVAMGDER